MAAMLRGRHPATEIQIIRVDFVSCLMMRLKSLPRHLYTFPLMAGRSPRLKQVPPMPDLVGMMLRGFFLAGRSMQL